MWHGSLAGRSRPALLMLPRFADIFQQGNRWLNWLEKPPEGSVRPVVIEIGDADDFLDCFIIPARIVGGTFWG
ncbi:putative transposase domain protein [Escherichia coli P0298942.1]|nr:putative transposase domain protein [Escherichia coli P0298942.1]ENB70256.1 putative transposase domain protein [Escherichia coli P0298942.15]END81508.1 putative transposase domain protein [Escherichia coli P0298942.4]